VSTEQHRRFVEVYVAALDAAGMPKDVAFHDLTVRNHSLSCRA
jgi:hypothetical protein